MNEDIYFENVLDIGHLYLYKVLNVFEDENIIFVCKDKQGAFYLGICYEFRYKLEWILCKTEAKLLHDMVRQKIDIYTVFKLSEDPFIQVIYENDNEISKYVSKNEFDVKYLPTEGVYFKPDKEHGDLSLAFCNSLIASQRFFNYDIEILTKEEFYKSEGLFTFNSKTNITYNFELPKEEKQLSFSNLNHAA